MSSLDNRTQELRMWAVMNQHDKLVGLDQASGGYPWVPADINGMKFWPTLDKAQEYCDIMNGGSYGTFTPVEVKLVIL